MKIIGKTPDGFIAEVNQNEIQKFFNTYYNKVPNVIVGDVHVASSSVQSKYEHFFI